MAKGCLDQTERRLSRNGVLRGRYENEMEEILRNYSEVVPDDEIGRSDGKVWYLPHHAVLNPKKPEKTRIVWNASMRYKGTSLNDQIHQGPDLTNTLIGVLLRFRQERVAFMADIRSMYNMTLVDKDDRDVLRFLWWEGGDMTTVPKVYRMKTHLFGGIWSPSCANYALKRTARDNKHLYSTETVDTVERSFYVDDCLKSVPTETDGIRLATDLNELLKRGGFNLTKYVSNSRALMKALPESELCKGVKQLDLDHADLPNERALGMIWDVENDTFQTSVSIQDRPLTKRGVLSVLSSVYDPMGICSPFVLNAKMIFQNLSRLKLGWDEEIPDDQKEQWVRWCDDLRRLEDFKVPRCLKPDEFGPLQHCQLHHFADASQSAYGVTSYVRLEDVQGRVHCSLLMAKAKLAPLKTVTIPRLELTAAVEAVKLDKYVKGELEIPIHETVFWTDSMIVLHYLNNEDKRYQTFVANRVAKILESTQPSQWRGLPNLRATCQKSQESRATRARVKSQILAKKVWLLSLMMIIIIIGSPRPS